jgi:hypothetical protein
MFRFLGNRGLARAIIDALPRVHGRAATAANMSTCARDSVRYKLAILNVLAKSPGGRATLDETRRAVEAAMTSAGQTEQLNRFFALGEIDIFQSGLVLQDDAGLRITDAGLSLLHSLESPSNPLFDPADSPPVRLTDKDAGLTERIRLFDLALTAPAIDSDEGIYDYQSALGEESRAVAYATPKVGAANLHASTDSAFRREWRQKSLKLDRLRAYIAAKKQFILGIWRHHLVRTSSATLNLKNKRLTQDIAGAAFAFLSLVLVIACVVIAIAFGQIQSLKSEIAMLRREFLPAKERITRLELVEKARRDSEQEEAQNKSDMDKGKLTGEARTDQTALNLSREEMQLIKEYIKPAPAAGSASPAINVGDPVSGAMIPLPSSLTEKVPKLLGGKFTTRDGAIIIVKRASRQVDAVLAPN